MQTARTVYRPLLAQATLGAAAPHSHAALRPAAISFARRSYATEAGSDKNTLQEMQAKQMRLVDKMGRRKQTPAIVSPVFSFFLTSCQARKLTWRVRQSAQVPIFGTLSLSKSGRTHQLTWHHHSELHPSLRRSGHPCRLSTRRD